ncbi:hypothetical protein NHX12_014667 [Muraenolepis orangiensis]|uniref:Claudin-34 n=1 Tax=Muraenolepis orangiensis TaxID=630683 RepID=A0A9Q0I5B9_9TELE|nr:hypothetical protein NHX12_014667 [Muraenolepis orangiensis]
MTRDLGRTANSQLMALWLSIVCWTVTTATLGVVQWRVWYVRDTSVITSGVASVGVWKTCFDSHVLVSPGYLIMFCRGMAAGGSAARDFPPSEIIAAQVLVPLALVAGLGGNAVGVYALRNVYFGLCKGRGRSVRLAFSCAGALFLLSSALSLGPLAWNLHAVLSNHTIAFPPEFHMPEAPTSQSLGTGIVVGMAAGLLMLVSGVVFLSYRPPPGVTSTTRATRAWTAGSEATSAVRGAAGGGAAGKDNPAFDSHERL